ncbi:Asp23/Gls24 family envelope stress response protein [Tissierella sp. Yu-01]|uniref:Asp23/Gls24 family envelope stress response protein n=1 Tax=Tissierella sp. Yu-01 TaxID=3035694 RepID=UPI00240D6692|nr:Asp23/Gls24 family envelope stress response protein [Tissierella sp. Yu-01]WFA09696.1 Asp23/Gls24 family envelope stress response protein [Tissierella sp. Yu-01]
MNEDTINNNVGSIRISNDVVAIIAGVAATEIKGVVGMSGGITGGITELLGMKNLSKGVKVEVGDKEAIIDIFLVIEYGSDLAKIGKEVQENVKASVENMTGLNVVNVNVNIQGISMPKEQKPETEQK